MALLGQFDGLDDLLEEMDKISDTSNTSSLSDDEPEYKSSDGDDKALLVY